MTLAAKRFVFFTGIILGICLIFLFRFPVHIQSSLNDLFPVRVNGRSLPKEVTNKYANIINIVVEAESFEKAKEKSDELFDRLKSLGMQNVTYHVPKNVVQNSMDYFKAHQNSFLSPEMRQSLLTQGTSFVREKAVNKIQSSWMPTIVPLHKDPFMLLTDYIQNMPQPVSSFSEKEGVLWQEREGKNYILILVKLSYDNINELIGQVRLIQQQALFENADYRVHLSGTPIHTVQMFEKTKWDISVISVLALLMLFVLTYLLFYRFGVVLRVAFNLLIAFISGILSVFLFSPTIHFLTFAFGTSLVGICIDYSFHRFYCQDSKSVLSKNIFYSFLTTISCFIPLLFSDFALLYQIALFTIGGLTGTFLWIFISPRPAMKASTGSSFKMIQIPFKRILLVCFIAVGVWGLVQIRMDHSPQNLYKPPKILQQEEAFFHQLNDKSFSYILLISGKNTQSVLEKEEKIKEKESFFSLSSVLPSLKKQEENATLIRDLYSKEAPKIKTELGLKKMPVFQQMPVIDEGTFQDQFGFLSRQFVLRTSDDVWSITPLAKKIELKNSDALIFEPAKYLSEQLDLYALKSYKNLAVSFILLFCILYIIYRKMAVRYLFPSLLGCAGTLGFLLLCGQGITFFHLLSLFVVIGLSMDYTIFLFSSQTVYKPVFFSFLSSFIGFGLLSFVHFRMIAIMGQTIALGLLLSFLTTVLVKKN